MLGIKPLLLKKRKLNGKHIKAIIPEIPFSLEEAYDEAFKSALKDGVLRARDLLRSRVCIGETEFLPEQLKFQTMANGNSGFSHLLMTLFLGRLYLSLYTTYRKIEHVGREKLRNMYLISAMAQRELTQTCLNLHEKEIARLENLHTRIEIDKQWWKDQLTGALSVARLCHIFLSEKAIVRFSRADEDLDWKIDLIVSFQGQSDGLCVQVKSDYRTTSLSYKTFDDMNENEMDDKANRFVHGVRLFQNKFRGIWIPIEITIGSKQQKTTSALPKEESYQTIKHMLRSVIY